MTVLPLYPMTDYRDGDSHSPNFMFTWTAGSRGGGHRLRIMGKLACSGRKVREEQQPACTGSTGIFGFAQDPGVWGPVHESIYFFYLWYY